MYTLHTMITRYCDAMNLSRYHHLRSLAFQLELAIESGNEDDIEYVTVLADEAYTAELDGYVECGFTVACAAPARVQ